ncbi:MAG: secondary thiamine-phosphate synthase enzyme YjbQ [Candidatus Cloacimonadota bacterium]|nr:secondary thiamine-phosphate synthase enzyme YjbQ [Candidatus Cloacimonadota bacterium]
MEVIKIETNYQFDFVNITTKIRNIVTESNISSGLVTIFVPHTTAGVTINEGADPAVAEDIIKELNTIIPLRNNYSHLEGNSAAHIKSSLMGCSQNVIVENGQLVLGTWQAIFFCDFDGPRHRKIFVKICEC